MPLRPSWRRLGLIGMSFPASYFATCVAAPTLTSSSHPGRHLDASALPPPRPRSPASASVGPQLPIEQTRSSIRVRVLGLASDEPTNVRWRAGGEGLGGDARKGAFVVQDGSRPPAVGEWSSLVPLRDVVPEAEHSETYFTITAGDSGHDAKRPPSRNVQFEIEQMLDRRLVQSLRASAVNGGTLTLVVPGPKNLGFVRTLAPVAALAQARRAWLVEQSSQVPVLQPRNLAVVSDLGGYGVGSGYGIRVTDPDVMRTELQSLAQLGVTGLRAAPDFVLQEGLPGAGRLRARVIGPIGYPTPDKRREPLAAGCPFAEGVLDRARQLAASTLARAQRENSDQVWALTQDEIGAVTDKSVEGKPHMASCDRCRAGFVRWLKEQHLTPARVGARSWAEVRPTSIWNNPDRPWLATEGLRRRAYLTQQFLNVASASMFTTIRDELARFNAAQRSASSAEPMKSVLSYALRGSTFLSNGSSLDFFEFYRHADNAIVWETSNRDARVWGWDSYLTDVQRVLGERLGVAEGIYIKPHRGAPIQRALSAVSRGNSMIYWYTFGPDYWKADAFSSDSVVLGQTQRAARLLGAAEPWLYGARLAQRPRVAIVRPETSAAWTILTAEASLQVASLENAKWVYSALQHAHVPVDPLDEVFLATSDLSAYAAIYVNGVNITARAAAALKRYVERGGVLVTTAGGLTNDEADAPLRALLPVFGVSSRERPALSCSIRTFRAVRLDSISDCLDVDRLRLSSGSSDMPLRIGRERLHPEASAAVLARFSDGAPAMLRHPFGKGQAYLLGTFAGLEYGAPVMREGFDMQQDLLAERRRALLEPIRDLLEAPVECSAPLVEPVLLESPGGGYALTLTNWAYAATDPNPNMTGNMHHVALQAVRDLKLVVHGVTSVARVHSVALNRDLDFERVTDGIALSLARLDEGDVLRLE